MKLSHLLRAAVFLLAGCLLVADAQGQTAISSVSPLAVAPGKTTELTIAGSGLTPPFSLWSSFAAQVEFPSDGDNAVDANPKKCKLTLAPETAVGLGAIVVGAAGGASEPFLVLIDDLNTVVEQDTNRAAASAQALSPPIAVDGASQAGASDFYRITAAAGQRLAFEIYAARIGSPLDAVMWLRDASGNELAYADDDSSAGADCRFAHTFAAAGDYLLEVRDNRYQGGHRYRLRIGDFPLVSSTWPLSARAGTTTAVAFAEHLGKEGKSSPSAAVNQFVSATADDAQAANHRAAGAQRLNVRGPTSNAAGLGSLSIGDLYESMEVEPNDDASQASAVSAPCAVNGRFETAGDKDHYRFVAKKGERLVFRSTTRRASSPASLALRVLRADGMAAAETPAPGEDDSLLSFTAPDDGEYLLQVEEVQSLAGPERVYRVEIERPLGFRLDFKSVAPGRDRFAAQGALAVDLVSVRDGYDGPIVISAQTITGESLVAFNNVIPAGQNEIKAIFVTGADWSGGQVRPIRIFGAREDGSSRQAARSTALLRARWPQQAFPPTWLDGLGYVGVLPKAPELYALKLPAEAPPLAAAATESSFVVAPERKDGNFKEALSIFLTNLPPGATYAVTREGDPPADKYTVKLTCPAELAAGDYRIRSFAYGELNGVGQAAAGEFLLHKAAP